MAEARNDAYSTVFIWKNIYIYKNIYISKHSTKFFLHQSHAFNPRQTDITCADYFKGYLC